MFRLESQPQDISLCICKYSKVFFKKIKNQKHGCAWWLTPVIPALWEAKAGGSQSQEFETSLTNLVRPCL